MTSGVFRSIPISNIIVNREGRQRRALTDIPNLADSINRLGLIQPIVTTRAHELVAGERRLAACTSLGHTHISIQYVDELDPPHLRAIELEENIKRCVLVWQDECRAVNEYYELVKSEDPTFSQKELGLSLGLSQPSVSQRIMVAQELLGGNERVIQAPKYSTAVGIVERASARKDDEALRQFRQIANIAKPMIEDDPIIVADFNQWAPTYDGPRFNFIH